MADFSDSCREGEVAKVNESIASLRYPCDYTKDTKNLSGHRILVEIEPLQGVHVKLK